ncbi:MAG: hypothetical protein JNL70_25715 [Saprospiraceae bacterium]|nr:hypothetical protein [Saprospiraceae bacterium]
MKFKNYMTITSLNVVVLMTCISACNSDQTTAKSNSSVKSDATAQQNKLEIGDFTLPDTILRMKVNEIGKVCLPIKSESNGSNFSVTVTKPTLNGTVTPSVNGNDICISFVPKSNFAGLDEFDCKVCLTNSGFCQEKTWRIAVSGEIKSVEKEETSSATKSKSPSPSKNTTKTTETTTPTPPTPSRSSIFDPEKKNNDGYVPGNNNNNR